MNNRGKTKKKNKKIKICPYTSYFITFKGSFVAKMSVKLLPRPYFGRVSVCYV